MNSLINIDNKQHVFNSKNVFIILHEENNAWIIGKDICKILDTDKAIRKHVDENDKVKYIEISRPAILTGLTYNEKKTIFINESGLYSLVLSSEKEAKGLKMGN